jgi:hypothetical protein
MSVVPLSIKQYLVGEFVTVQSVVQRSLPSIIAHIPLTIILYVEEPLALPTMLLGEYTTGVHIEQLTSFMLRDCQLLIELKEGGLTFGRT